MSLHAGHVLLLLLHKDRVQCLRRPQVFIPHKRKNGDSNDNHEGGVKPLTAVAPHALLTFSGLLDHTVFDFRLGLGVLVLGNFACLVVGFKLGVLSAQKREVLLGSHLSGIRAVLFHKPPDDEGKPRRRQNQGTDNECNEHRLLSAQEGVSLFTLFGR